MSTSINVAHRIDNGKEWHACPACEHPQSIPGKRLMTRSEVIQRRLVITVQGVCRVCGVLSDLPHLSAEDVFGD